MGFTGSGILRMDSPLFDCNSKTINEILHSFERLSRFEKNILISELLKKYALIGIVDNPQYNQFQLLPSRQTQESFLGYSEAIHLFFMEFSQLSDSCQAACLSNIVQSVSITIVVGAFEADQYGYFIYPVYPADSALSAVANGCHRSRIQGRIQERLLESVAVIIRHTRLSAIMDVEGAPFFFPLAYPQQYIGPSQSIRSPLLRAFDQTPKAAQGQFLADILKSIPLAIVIGAFTGEPEREIGRYVLPVAPVNEVLMAFTNAYKEDKED